MTNKKLANRVVTILCQPHIQKIGFNLNGLIVTGQKLYSVAMAIQMGNILCETVDKFPLSPGQKLSPGFKIAAMYMPDKDTMLFSREDYAESSESEKSVVVHEATHAMFDLFATSNNHQVLAIDDESAGVLSQALYLRIGQDKEQKANAANVAKDKELISNSTRFDIPIQGFKMFVDESGYHAMKIIDQMMAETGNFTSNSQIYNLKGDQLTRFRQAVAREWDCIKDEKSDRSGVQSVYDGVTPLAVKNAQKAGAALRGGTKIF